MNKHLNHFIFFILLVSTALSANKWTPEFMIQYQRLGGTDIAPNGNWVAYELSVPQMEGEKSEFLTHIWLVSSDGQRNFQLTQGDVSSRSPRFSPDGKHIAFISGKADPENNFQTTKGQIYVLPIDGGERKQITAETSSVGRIAWSPDGQSIAFTMRDPETEEEKRRKEEKRDWKIIDTNYRYSHLYVVEVSGNNGARRLTKGKFQVGSFDWSPDSKRIVFDHMENPTANAWTTSDISVVNVRSGSKRSLVDWNGSDRSPKYSPDGKSIAFSSDGGNPTWGREHFVYVIPANGGNGSQLPATPSRYISSITGWTPNGTAVIVSESNRTSRRYFNIPLSENGVVSTLTPGKGNYGSLSYNKEGMIAFVHEKTEEPGNVFISRMNRFNPAQITNVNPEFSTMVHGKTEVIHWESKDGMEIEGLLTYPINYREGKKVPLVLNIHGGPAGVYTEGYTGRSSVYPIQAYAQEGYAVLRANPRGSSGYSKAFRFANRSDWGGMDYEDLMTGVDHLIKLGVADPNDLYVMGWSYGGFMTSTVVTKTDRFKAASVGAGVPNLIGMLTTDIHDFIPWHFEGEMHDNIEKYIKHSALFHVNNVTTPTQVVHGENDTRVPIAQGYEFYRAIQRKGVDTEMIVYPRMPHGLREPKFIQHCGEAIMKWFKDHSK
jgi:dipeptidyl aminopeptidase/acylaminoacyl peptidase